jgi:hypothetical protein
VFATGNNLTVVGDFVRRTIVRKLDAEMETPWTRQSLTSAVVHLSCFAIRIPAALRQFGNGQAR